MQQFEVVEIVNQNVTRERRWFVPAMNEQDAIRRVKDQQVPEKYSGERNILLGSDLPEWRVDGEDLKFSASEAMPEADDLHDMGGGD